MGLPQRDRQRDQRASGACNDDVRALAAPCWKHDRRQVTAAGFDDFRQLAVGGTINDPLAAPVSTGLRVPPALVGAAYRFLLCVADLEEGDTIVGIRQGMEIGAMIAMVGDSGILPPIYPLVRPVTTYNWRFVDGGQVWTLTSEPKAPPYRTTGPFDQESFSWRDAGASALVYASAAFPGSPLLPGYLGLTAYTPPAMQGHKVLTARDLRWPFDSPQADEELWIPVDRPTRFRLYCDVLQTDPVMRNHPTLGTDTNVRQITGNVPEEEFVQYVQGLPTVAMGVNAWRVHGRIIWDTRRLAK